MKEKKIFNFHIPAYKAFWNRIDYSIRHFYILAGAISIFAIKPILRGLKSSEAAEEKDRWFIEHVRNPQDPGFSNIDDYEEPPRPLTNTPIDQFKREFRRLREKEEMKSN